MGLIAAEAGEFEEARRQADRGADMVDEPRLAALLEARAAEVAGDTAAAERAYSGMLQTEETEILGRKGLLAAALKRGDRTSALAHAEAALRLSKSATWPFQSAFELKVQAGDWEGAIDVLEQGEKRKLLDKRAADRRRAVLLTAAATRAERERTLDKAADMALKAAKLAPGFAPAAAMAARLYTADGRAPKAQDILEDAWAEGPHPSLANAYRDLVTDEAPQARAERMMALVEKRRDHRESRIISAQAAIARQDWSLAQAAIDDVMRENPSNRAYALMAQLARGRGDEAQAGHYLAIAATAPRESDWSDLDPEGAGFLYDDQDWARMVYMFGDSGVLVHPRLDRPTDGGYVNTRALPPASAGDDATVAA
jgi:HemY protein